MQEKIKRPSTRYQQEETEAEMDNMHRINGKGRNREKMQYKKRKIVPQWVNSLSPSETW